jgi:hypothetical protein
MVIPKMLSRGAGVGQRRRPHTGVGGVWIVFDSILVTSTGGTKRHTGVKSKSLARHHGLPFALRRLERELFGDH